MNASQYQILIDGEIFGPYSKVQVEAMYESGTITSDSYYWTEGLPDWLPIAQFISKKVKPLVIIPEKKQPKQYGCGTVVLVLVVLVFILGIISSPTTRTASSQDKFENIAHKIIIEDTPLTKAINTGFKALDRSLSGNYNRSRPNIQVATEMAQDIMLAGVTVNKMMESMSEDDLTKTFSAWCIKNGSTSYTKLPSFISTCQTKNGKRMTDTLSNIH